MGKKSKLRYKQQILKIAKNFKPTSKDCCGFHHLISYFSYETLLTWLEAVKEQQWDRITVLQFPCNQYQEISPYPMWGIHSIHEITNQDWNKYIKNALDNADAAKLPDCRFFAISNWVTSESTIGFFSLKELDKISAELTADLMGNAA